MEHSATNLFESTGRESTQSHSLHTQKHICYMGPGKWMPGSGIPQWVSHLIWVLLIVLALPASADTGPGNIPSRYHYEDIDRFFAAYERFLETGSPAAFRPYLDEGSTGMADFRKHFQVTPEHLAETVRKYPKFFASISDLRRKVQASETELDAMFEKLQALFPDHPMPDVYFLVGGLRARGQGGDGNYVMIAAEVYADMPGVDLSEFTAKSRMFTPLDIVHIVAHEAAHIIQEEIQGTERYLSIYTEDEKGTVLAYALREGAPNLVAKLVSGGHINQEAEAWGLAHEAELWPVFREDAMKTDLGDWFFYQPKTHPEWPRDLGYWIGYRMALKCYEEAADKEKMLFRILDAADPEAILADCAP